MANLYDKAGLVNIPVGYQEGFLYNIKPTDNTLAFRFNRDSAATRVNKEGLIEQVGYFGPELVQNGDFATDSDWVKGAGWTISGGKANAVNASNQSLSQSTSSVLLNKKYRISLDVEYISGSAKFQLVGGTTQDVITITSSGTQVIEVVSNANKASYRIKGLTTDGGFNGSIDNISIKEVLGDKPRIDYTDSLTSPSFLLEPQSTNVLENSEITSTWTYTEYGSGSSGTITTGKTDMFGGTNAAQIDFPADAENVTLTFGQTTSSISSGSASGSVYIKLVESGSKTLQLRCSPSLTNLVNVDTTKFVRYQLSGTKNNNEVFNLKLRPSAGTSSGGFSIIVCQPQEEALSYPTSYIPTAGSTVTRAQETCNGAGSVSTFNSTEGVSTFNSTEGVLYAEIAALVNDSSVREISLSDGTANNRIELRYGAASNRLQLVARSSGSVQASISNSDYNILLSNKVAVKYKANDFALWINGVEVGTDTSGNAPSGLSELAFDDGNGTSDFYGKTKGVYVFNEALTDDELQQLTGPEYNSFAALAAAYNYTVI
jgi:hypothetical protein